MARQKKTKSSTKASIAFEEAKAQVATLKRVGGKRLVFGELPSLDASVDETLTSLLRLHGAFTLFALIGFEGLKKSKPFSKVSGAVTNQLDQFAETDLREQLARKAHQLGPYIKFVRENDVLLRKLAGHRRAFQWLHASLDWLASKPASSAGDASE
jgi:hypothetical protein